MFIVGKKYTDFQITHSGWDSLFYISRVFNCGMKGWELEANQILLHQTWAYVKEILCPAEWANGLYSLGVQGLKSMLIWDNSFKCFGFFWNFNKVDKNKPCHSSCLIWFRVIKVAFILGKTINTPTYTVTMTGVDRFLRKSANLYTDLTSQSKLAEKKYYSSLCVWDKGGQAVNAWDRIRTPKDSFGQEWWVDSEKIKFIVNKYFFFHFGCK